MSDKQAAAKSMLRETLNLFAQRGVLVSVGRGQFRLTESGAKRLFELHQDGYETLSEEDKTTRFKELFPELGVTTD